MASRFKPPVLLKVADLLLDQRNPRIPPEKRNLEQDDLVAFVADTYFALAIARSIASHQYFSSEPLIAIPDPASTKHIVVEGNRRLSALKLLLNSDLRDKLPNRAEWDALDTKNVPSEVPVVIVNDRREVAPIIGYRHISGIQPWDPLAKARYIADQIGDGLSFKDVAEEVGESESTVKSNYQNFYIADQAGKLELDPQALEGMKSGFGVFTRAMQNANIREYIGAPTPQRITKNKRPISTAKKDALKEMVGMLFGPAAVIDDSRQITDLGKVVASKEGLKLLRKERNLQDALIVSGGVLERLLNRLATAARNLRAAGDDLPTYKKDKSVQNLLADCDEALNNLKSVK